MGSKKRKDKDKERERDPEKSERKSKKNKHKSPSSPEHHSKKEKKDKSHKKSKEKRRHSESEDSDVPIAKSARYDHYDDDGGVSRSPEVRQERPRHVSKSPSPPRSSGGGGDASLSIEETNRLRAKLGLKPLQVSSAPPRQPPKKLTEEDEKDENGEDFDEETLQRIRQEREQENETFWKEEKKDFVHVPAENMGSKIQEEKIREKIKAVREKRRLEDRLAGAKGLADSSDEELDDAAKWVEKQKKAAEQKALAEKRAKALAELDDEFGTGDLVEQDFQKKKNNAYTAKDIKGMKVLHSQERIDTGGTVILTLKDKGVLDEEDDTLVNVNMIDDEKFEKNIETRKLRPELHGYNAYDEIEFDNEGNLKEKGVLAKYDEEIDKAANTKSFVIGENISEEVRKAKIREKMQKANKVLESLESTNLRLASDYYTPDEMTSFKKTKRRVKKIRKVEKLRADDLIKMDSDVASSSSRSHSERDRGSRSSRGSNLPETSKSSRESKRSSAYSSQSDSVHLKNEPMDMDVDLDIDDLPPAPSNDDIWSVKVEDEADLDFQLALNKVRKLKQKAAAKPSLKNMVDSLRHDEEEEMDKGPSGNIVLHATAEFCRTLGDIPSVEGVDIYGDEEMDFETEEKMGYTAKEEERGRWNEVEIDETPVDVTRAPDVEETPILEQEPNVGTGLAGALKLAQKKGYLLLEDQKRGAAVSAKMKDLQAQNYSIEDKNYDDERTSKRDMYAGPTTDFKEKEHYKPDVKLDYVDEDGKPISSKEAFRLLSHKFHGKGSGKNKIDKKRRKVEQEKLMQHMNSTDTPLNTLELLQQRQKETQSAYIVLTGKAQTSLTKSKR